MGNYNNKNFITMTDANVIVETATADCPLVNLTLTGANKDDTETFETAGYTDGYLAEVELTWEATYWAVMVETDDGTNSAASFIARTNEDNAVTATANPNGAWFALQAWTTTSAADYSSASFYIPALAVAISSTSTGAVTLAGATGDVYGLTAAVDVDTADQVTGGAVSYSFLMPISASDSETGATDAAAGDRFDKGTTVAYYNSIGASETNAATACQAESDDLSLGASALVAGSVAFAAALAF